MIDYEREEQEWEDFCRLGVELKNLTAQVKNEFRNAEKFHIKNITISQSTMSIEWYKDSLGAGKVSVTMKEDGSFACANEYLHPSIVRKILLSAADKLADDIILTEE